MTEAEFLDRIESVERQAMDRARDYSACKLQLEMAIEALEEVEWEQIEDVFDFSCPWCGEWKSDGHASDCSRQRALTALRGKRRKEAVTVEIPLHVAQRLVYCLEQMRALFNFMAASTSPYHMIGVAKGFVNDLRFWIWPSFDDFKEDLRILSSAITQYSWPSEEKEKGCRAWKPPGPASPREKTL